jgi:hypothetical protein
LRFAFTQTTQKRQNHVWKHKTRICLCQTPETKQVRINSTRSESILAAPELKPNIQLMDYGFEAKKTKSWNGNVCDFIMRMCGGLVLVGNKFCYTFA